jgi:hypothetical protein
MKSVIVIPRSAAINKESGFVAYVQKGLDQFDALPVTLGQGDAAQVVVTEGLEAGQVLALNPPDLKQDFSKKARKTDNDSAKSN